LSRDIIPSPVAPVAQSFPLCRSHLYLQDGRFDLFIITWLLRPGRIHLGLLSPWLWDPNRVPLRTPLRTFLASSLSFSISFLHPQHGLSESPSQALSCRQYRQTAPVMTLFPIFGIWIYHSRNLYLSVNTNKKHSSPALSCSPRLPRSLREPQGMLNIKEILDLKASAPPGKGEKSGSCSVASLLRPLSLLPAYSRPSHPLSGIRIGEASHPGPSHGIPALGLLLNTTSSAVGENTRLLQRLQARGVVLGAITRALSRTSSHALGAFVSSQENLPHPSNPIFSSTQLDFIFSGPPLPPHPAVLAVRAHFIESRRLLIYHSNNREWAHALLVNCYREIAICATGLSSLSRELTILVASLSRLPPGWIFSHYDHLGNFTFEHRLRRRSPLTGVRIGEAAHPGPGPHSDLIPLLPACEIWVSVWATRPSRFILAYSSYFQQVTDIGDRRFAALSLDTSNLSRTCTPVTSPSIRPSLAVPSLLGLGPLEEAHLSVTLPLYGRPTSSHLGIIFASPR
jgi:hypothetical protein